MLFRFRLEELKDLVRHLFVQRQRVKVRARRCSGNGFIELLHRASLTRFWRGKIQWRWFRRKREAIALLENGDIIGTFFAGVADFQKNRFQQRNSIRKEFRQRPVEIAPESRVQGVLKDVREFAGNFRESRKSIARRSAAQRVSRDVKPVQVFAARLHILKHAHILPQILQVLRGFLVPWCGPGPLSL